MAAGLTTAMGVYVVGLMCRLRGGSLSSYQGIADSTLIHPWRWYWSRFANSFKDIFYQIFVVDVYDNKYIMLAVILTWVLTLILIICFSVPLIKSKRFLCVAVPVTAIILMPMSVYCMNLLSDGVGYYSVMLSGISMVWLLPITILDAGIKLDGGKWKKVISNVLLVCLCANLWNYILVDNISYLASSVSNSRTYALVERIVDRIESTDGYEDMKCVWFYGNVSGQPYTSWTFTGKTIIGDGIIPYGNTTYGYYCNNYIRKLPLLFDTEKMTEIQNTQEFKDMPVWPEEGCTRLIDDVMVIRLSETE